VTSRAELPLAIDSMAPGPLYVRIARALAADVKRGRLRPGAALPGTRTLAQQLGVHRNTVLAAYAELLAEGWLEARQGGGTFVSTSLPEPAAQRVSTRAPRAGMAEEPAFALQPESDPVLATELPHAELVMLGGVPDLRHVPTAALARAYRRALRERPATRLAYGRSAGEPRLRQALAEFVSRRRGLAASAENVLVTRGSQMALDLVARALCAPGDVVAVEALGYRPAWNALSRAGARLLPIPVDADGLDVTALSRAAARERIRAVYVTPHHQYPTLAVLSPGRRMELLELCARKRIAILEDDYDHEFHYDGRPILPLASADTRGSVVYVGTLSKVLAPGLRIGFVVASTPLIERLTRERFAVDRQGDHVLEAAVAELVEDGELERHSRKMRRLYLARRNALVTALDRHLGPRFVPVVPAGGMALWGRVAGRVDIEHWRAECLARGVLFMTARDFAFDSRVSPFARLGFAALTESELEEAARRMAAAWPGK
jgi:GntR family transcriptional regulator / MocR family aminotransferase